MCSTAPDIGFLTIVSGLQIDAFSGRIIANREPFAVDMLEGADLIRMNVAGIHVIGSAIISIVHVHTELLRSNILHMNTIGIITCRAVAFQDAADVPEDFAEISKLANQIIVARQNFGSHDQIQADRSRSTDRILRHHTWILCTSLFADSSFFIARSRSVCIVSTSFRSSRKNFIDA